MRLRNRVEAGKLLAARLLAYRGKEAVVFAVPRGGVVLGVVVARALGAGLDLVITRKIGHPANPEYAIGAVAEDKEVIFNEEAKSLDPSWLKEAVGAARAEVKRRREVYLGGRMRPEVAGKIAIVIDDGVATGLTFLLALKEIRQKKPARLVAAVPVLPQEAAEKIRKVADELVALEIDWDFLGAVGAYYDDFPQVTDQEVVAGLDLFSAAGQ